MIHLTKYAYLAIAWLCVGLGVIGIILPVFPTTPFLIVAVWAFSRSSPELAEKIRYHPIVGRYIRDWEADGVIPVWGKMFAVLAMAGSASYMLFFNPIMLWISLPICAVFVAVGAYVVSRPSRRPKRASDDDQAKR
jgi:uncharacterized protein